MQPRMRCVSLYVRGLSLVPGIVLAAMTVHAQQPQTPVFRSSVEVTSIDVGVVDDRGRPVMGLGPADFTVQIDGAMRRVVSADWVSLVTPARPAAPLPPEGFSSNENSTGGRLILIVIDQPNIRFGGAAGIRKAVDGFIDSLLPSDRIAVVGIGPGPPSTPFTADRELLKRTVARMAGSRSSVAASRRLVSMSEALAIRRGDPGAFERVVARECDGSRPGSPTFELCISELQEMVHEVAQDATNGADTTIASLRALFTGLRPIDLPKTMVIVSEGFIVEDRLSDVAQLGTLAAAARTSIYALKLDDVMFSDIDQSRVAEPTSRFDDARLKAAGIETLAVAARGTLFNISVAADGAFGRIESELSGYYLLGVESGVADRDGKAHPIRVQVSRRGATVRSRRQFMTNVEQDRPRSPRDVVMAALGSPLMIAALPLQVATFSLRGPDPAKIQLLIHAAVGTDYATSKVVTLGYIISDREGRIVESLAGDARLPPVMNGVPSALQYNVGSSIPPGDYTLKLAVAEGDRVGTVEHPIHAALVDAAPVKLSELMVGGPTEVRQLDRPTIGHTVAFGSVHGYVEAYGVGVGSLKARYEIATDADSPALLDADAPGRPAGGERTIFSHVMLVRQLPPGRYVLRAIVSTDAGPVKTLTRDFEVAAPAVLMTTATGGGAMAVAPQELFLPVGEELFARPFHREEISRPATLKAFRERVVPAVRGAFDSGVAALSAGDFVKAETALKSAIQDDADSTPVLAYLAAAFAASGHDLEAASAWQTALIGGDEFPQIYLWLGDALMRTRDLAQARTVLEEAAAKWPSDLRFTKPLALLYATFGQGREAVRTLERYLSDRHDDVEALFLGVEWIYQLHSAGAVAQTNAEDVKLARVYASAYEKARGPQIALLKQWTEFLEGRKR
jgi:VWFA-related protein